MDMIWLTFPSPLTAFFSSLGFLFFSIILYKVLIWFEWKLFKSNKPLSTTEYKIFLLEEENKKLNKKIKDLEEENTNMINSLLKHLQG